MNKNKKVNLTVRDLEVVKFIENTNLPLTAVQVSKLFFWSGNEKSSLVRAQRRLLALYKMKKICRARNYVGEEYIYYLKKTPTQLKHKQLIVDFLCQLNLQNFKILSCELEWKGIENAYGIRPDLFLTVEYNQKKYNFIVEVDNTKTFTNSEKYSRFVSNKNSDTLIKSLVRYPMLLISVCSKKPEPIELSDGRKYKPLWINSDFSNATNLTYIFVK